MKTLMKDAPIGELVFVEEAMNDEKLSEMRETFYRRVSETMYRRHGVMQGTTGFPPRYVRWDSEGYEYPLVDPLVIHPVSESRFYHLWSMSQTKNADVNPQT